MNYHQCQYIRSERDEMVCEICGQVSQANKFTNDISFLANGIQTFQHTKKIQETNTTDEEIQKTLDLLKEQLEVEPEYYEAFDIAKRLLKLKLANQASDRKFINSIDENEQLKEQLPYLKFYVGAALYFGFRSKQAPYLLIEISDKIPMVIKEGKKVVKLARCYLKLLKFLQQDAPKDQKLSSNFQFIDPSIYIPKFVKALEFNKEKQTLIIDTTKKLVKRMMLDWMGHGRRPSSLCGAALLISAKFHGENLSTATVCKTVKVCDETIRKRLAEFNQTSLAQLTRAQFESIQNIETEVPGGYNDPPAFVRARKQEKELEEATMKKALLLSEILNKKPQFIRKEEELDEDELQLSSIKQEQDRVIKEDLSELADNEIEEFFLTKTESEYRQKMWNNMYNDWIKIKEQKQKKTKLNENKKEQKRKNNQVPLNSESVKDAVKHQFQNVNENALEEMFEDKIEEPSETFMDKINKILKQSKQE